MLTREKARANPRKSREYIGYSGHTLCIQILNGIHRVFRTRAEPVKNPWKTRANLCYFPRIFVGSHGFRLVGTYSVFFSFCYSPKNPKTNSNYWSNSIAVTLSTQSLTPQVRIVCNNRACRIFWFDDAKKNNRFVFVAEFWGRTHIDRNDLALDSIWMINHNTKCIPNPCWTHEKPLKNPCGPVKFPCDVHGFVWISTDGKLFFFV